MGLYKVSVGLFSGYPRDSYPLGGSLTDTESPASRVQEPNAIPMRGFLEIVGPSGPWGYVVITGGVNKDP